MTAGTQSTSGTLPKASREYDEQQFNLLIRELEDRFVSLEGFRFLKGSGMLLIGLQEGGVGLEINRVYEENGFLKIVKQGSVFVASTSMSTSVGTVTVAVT
jgi:hypothetical protein